MAIDNYSVFSVHRVLYIQFLEQNLRHWWDSQSIQALQFCEIFSGRMVSFVILYLFW